MTHLYGGNRSNYPVAITLMDDGTDVPSFVNFNTGYEGNADRASYTIDRALSDGWQGYVEWLGGSGDTGPMCVAWNDSPIGTGESAQMWLIAAYHASTGAHDLYYTSSQDTTFTQLGAAATMLLGSGQQLYAIAVDGSGNVYASIVSTGGSNMGIYKMAPGGSAYTLLASAGGGSDGTDFEMVWVPGTTNLVVAFGSSVTGLSGAFLGYAPLAGIGINNVEAMSTVVESWALKVGGPSSTPYALAIAKAASSAPVVWKTSNGSAWSSAAIALGSTDVPIDLTWNSQQALWILAVNVAGAGTTALWSSPDGVSWTYTGVTLANALFASLAPLGPYFAATRLVSSLTPRNGWSQFCTSPDGKTWNPQPIWTPQVSGSPAAKLAASPAQLVMFDPMDISHYGYTRFSGIYGMGDQPLT